MPLELLSRALGLKFSFTNLSISIVAGQYMVKILVPYGGEQAVIRLAIPAKCAPGLDLFPFLLHSISEVRGLFALSYRIIIHVGPWKTGSTALQEFFHINREKLLSYGILYPVGLVAPQAHHEIPNIFKNTMLRFMPSPNPTIFDWNTIQSNYFEQLRINKVDTLLLSSEDFAGLNADQFSQLFESLTGDSDSSLELIFLTLTQNLDWLHVKISGFDRGNISMILLTTKS